MDFIEKICRSISDRLLLDSGSIDAITPRKSTWMGECSGANTWVRPYAPPNVGANLVFAHYARFALMPKSCDSTALCYTHSVDQPGIR